MASKRDRLRATQLAQLEAPAALAEVEKAPPKRKKHERKAVPPTRESAAPKARLPKDRGKKSPARAEGGNRGVKFRAAQQAQLEALPALGEADKVLLGPSRRRKAREREPARPRALRRKAGFQSLLLARLDTGPILAEVERELLSLPEERGLLDALNVALARLKVRLTGDGLRARRREAEPVALAGEETAPEVVEAVAPVTARPGLVSDGFKKVTTLTAALEEMGVAREDFGFTVTFGSLVSEEDRDSVFSVSGVGLAELSHHLAKWFEQAGRSDFPLQVIDEGSGELKIFISET